MARIHADLEIEARSEDQSIRERAVNIICQKVTQGDETAEKIAINVLHSKNAHPWSLGLLAKCLRQREVNITKPLIAALGRIYTKLFQLSDAEIGEAKTYLAAINRVAGTLAMKVLPEEFKPKVGQLRNLIDRLVDPSVKESQSILARLDAATEGRVLSLEEVTDDPPSAE